MFKEMRGINIAATKSGSGKTMAALAVMKLLKDKGLKVAPFKTGPDFIDTSHYETVCGARGRNLDTFMMSKEFIFWNLYDAMMDKDVAVIEGVMGLFDGYGEEAKGSTAELAKILQFPVLLIVDAKGMSQSVVPLIHGFLNWDKSLHIVGIILNRVNSEKHYSFLKSRIEKLGVKCVGYIPSTPEIAVPERHLGIIMGHERSRAFEDGLKKIAASIDENKLLQFIENSARRPAVVSPVSEEKLPVKIAIAKDEAFNFIYEENIRLFELNGGYVNFFSPLRDESFGRADLVYIPGGYPELYLKELTKNKIMKETLTEFVEGGGYLLAECGGLIYMSDKIKTDKGVFDGVGLLPFTIEMGRRFASLGYVDVTAVQGNPFFREGTELKGHRFHYSYIKEQGGELSCSYILKRKDSEEKEGYVYKNMLASYVHLHFGSNPAAVRDIFERITAFNRNLQLL